MPCSSPRTTGAAFKRLFTLFRSPGCATQSARAWRNRSTRPPPSSTGELDGRLHQAGTEGRQETCLLKPQATSATSSRHPCRNPFQNPPPFERLVGGLAGASLAASTSNTAWSIGSTRPSTPSKSCGCGRTTSKPETANTALQTNSGACHAGCFCSSTRFFRAERSRRSSLLLRATRQLARHAPRSLSLGSFGDATRTP